LIAQETWGHWVESPLAMNLAEVQTLIVGIAREDSKVKLAGEFHAT
jgi:hypothetical protein